MNTKTLKVFLLLQFALQTMVIAADVGWPAEVLKALNYTGSNRRELESALRKVMGKDTEYLLAHASQYDLVNLTSQQIVENVTYARKVHRSLPYLGKKLDDGLWREWVLPHRVLDEDVCLWRKEFYERMQPLVKGKKSVREVVEVIHTWLMEKDGTGSARIAFGTVHSENRCKTPSQMFRIGTGGCGELSMMFVYLLRAVGIPARHCLMSSRYEGIALHYYCEYWDPQLRQWMPLDASDDKPIPPPTTPQERSGTQGLGSLAFYAHPGFFEARDCYHTACFAQCLPVTSHMFDTHDVEFGVPRGFAGTATAYVWNSDAWRPVARGSIGKATDPPVQLADAKPSADRPVLFTATDGEPLLWALQRPSAKSGKVELVKAEAGVCLKWAVYGKP